MTNKPKLLLALSLFILCCGPSSATGQITFLPESHHHQFRTFGFFIEDQTTVVLKDGGRAWGGFGGAFALAELSEWSLKPQLLVLASANFAFRSNKWALDFLTETFDGRFGMGVEMTLNPNLRFSVGLVHLSGHTADSIVDRQLMDVNLGDDSINMRVIYDYGKFFRLGATLKPFINTDPVRQFFAADQFAEWFPFGALDSSTTPSPYLAVGLDEDGAKKIDLTFHAQLGIYIGHHFSPEYKQALRVVFGYYNGWDPRSKYARLRDSRPHFIYGGMMFEL